MELYRAFANTGDKEDFSVDSDPNGAISLEKGFTTLYDLKPEEGGLFISRKAFNQIMYLISNDVVKWKKQTFPDWIADKGDGIPMPYPIGAIVKYTDGNLYVSKINNNATLPTNTTNWQIFDGTNFVQKTGNETIAGVKTFASFPTTPESAPTTNFQVANKQYVDNRTPNASETAVGLIELATSAEAQAGTDNQRAITPLRLRDALNAGGTAPIYPCRAWVNFNGTGVVSIRGSGNVSSIIDNGVGNYTVNFTIAMPDANGCIHYTHESSSRSTGDAISSASSNSVTVLCGSNGSAYDATINSVTVFR